MKVSELEGAALDYWVAKADGWPEKNGLSESEITLCGIRPSTSWDDGGPIIHRKQISLDAEISCGEIWAANMPECWPPMIGRTPLIAAMRCFVRSKYGDEVPDA